MTAYLASNVALLAMMEDISAVWLCCHWGAAYRHYWELSVLYGVQARLRSGDLWVPGSRRYTDPTTLLIPPESWVAQRTDFCTVTGTDADPLPQLQRLETELHVAVTDLERMLAHPASEGLARMGEDDRDTRFSDAFTHAGGAQPRNPDLIRNLYASVLAYACNLGYAGMADASGISEDTLAWTSQWYLRPNTLSGRERSSGQRSRKS